MDDAAAQFEPDQELIARMLAFHRARQAASLFNDSDEARRKQDTPFADQRADREDGDGPVTPRSD